MGDVDIATDKETKKPRLLRSEANKLCKRKAYYKNDDKQERLRERIALLYRQREEVDKKIADLEKFLMSPNAE
jgi:hypothetical protein